MNKVVGVTKPIYELCKVLEEFEEDIIFSVFYPFSRILESHLFCPGFYFDGVYYEIQYDDENVLRVVDFGVREWKVVGDILVKGNKIYSPETCCFVPQEINLLFVKNNVNRGILPIGVHKGRNKFKSVCSTYNEINRLGTFDTPLEAFIAYKTFKETHVKKLADKWRGQITERCYNALMDYKVEIDD